MKSDPSTPYNVRQRQQPLRQRYRESTTAAWVVDHAHVEPLPLDDPLHGRVRFGSASQASCDFAVHAALGGLHDGPTPGDLLCAALASCQESSLRMAANAYGVRLAELEVSVDAGVDVRGTLGMDPKVPVSFQTVRVHLHVRAVPGTDPQRLAQVVRAAERACVVLQTLRAGVLVELRVGAAVQS